MLPLLILVIPPSVAGGGYACWYLGQQTALSSLFQSSKTFNSTVIPSQTLGSYIAGFGTLFGMYRLQSSQFYRLEDTINTEQQIPHNNNNNMQGVKNSSSARSSAYVPPRQLKPTQSYSQQFQPPKSITEGIQRMARPVLLRTGAGCIAFFCSGMVQTLVTIPR